MVVVMAIPPWEEVLPKGPERGQRAQSQSRKSIHVMNDYPPLRERTGGNGQPIAVGRAFLEFDIVTLSHLYRTSYTLFSRDASKHLAKLAAARYKYSVILPQCGIGLPRRK
jgi:hypothetical protein